MHWRAAGSKLQNPHRTTGGCPGGGAAVGAAFADTCADAFSAAALGAFVKGGPSGAGADTFFFD